MGLFREGAVEAREDVLSPEELEARESRCPEKLLRFRAAGYKPHYYQNLFHTSYERYRVASAGRRGGKTEGSAWEFAYLCDPTPIRYRDENGNVVETTVQRYELRKYGVKLPPPNKPIVNLVFTPDTKNYPATKRKVDDALDALGIPYDYNENKQTWYIPSKQDRRCIVYWRGTDKPRSARGEGFCAGFGDEPAFILSSSYIDSLEPAFSDHKGIFIFSTTPSDDVDNWWFYDYYIAPQKVDGRWVGRRGIGYFEWTSLENPYFDEDEYEARRERLHPLIFVREYMARWDKGGGKLLKLKWLHYYDPARDLAQLPDGGVDWSKYELYAGIDPASSLRTSADYFVSWVIALDRSTGQAYMVDFFQDKLEFPDQVQHIKALKAKWPGLIRIGIESVGYQAVLEQQVRAERIPGTYPIRPGRIKKEDRIMQLAPTFKSRKVLIRHDMAAFMNEWEQFPNGQHDDTLDAADIAIRTIASMHPVVFSGVYHDAGSDAKLLERQDPDLDNDQGFYDEEMGSEW